MVDEQKLQLSIQDIYVQDARARADRDFDPMVQYRDLNIQMRIDATHELSENKRANENQPPVLIRYFVETGIRLLKPNVNPESAEITDADLLAEITAVFVVRYLSNIRPEEKVLKKFSERAIHHMWPYWREFIHASTSRLRLPGVVLPMKGLHEVTLDSADLEKVAEKR